MKTFEQLTHVGKGRRLRPYAAKLLEIEYGIRAETLEQVAETVNVVYRVQLKDGSRCVLRLTPPKHFHDRQDVQSEVAWLHSLAKQSIGVPTVIAARNGNDVVTVVWDGIPGEWHGVVFEWIQGVNLANRWTATNIERFGQLVAQLHVAGSQFAPPPGFRLRPANSVFPHCNTSFAHPEPMVLFDGLPKKLLPAKRGALFTKAYALAEKEIERLFREGAPQPIHNDLHPWNVMISRDEIHAIDFENSLMGFPVQDLGTVLNYWQNYFKDDVAFDERLASFRAGYERIQPWPEEYPGQIRLLTASHRLMLCNYYASHHDPEYREFAYEVFPIVEKRLAEDLAAFA